MELMHPLGSRISYVDSLKALESDIEHANALACAIPTAKGGARVQMKLACNQIAPLVLLLLEWLDCSCACLLPRYLTLFHILVYKIYPGGRKKSLRHGRKATIREFYAVLLPSLTRLHASTVELNTTTKGLKAASSSFFKSGKELDRGDECGICLETGSKIVLPNCCHAMCINCYRDWNSRSESCPFCRGTLKRVNSEDLWILTCEDDVVDSETIRMEDLLGFHMYINTLPRDSPDALFLVYYEYLI